MSGKWYVDLLLVGSVVSMCFATTMMTVEAYRHALPSDNGGRWNVGALGFAGMFAALSILTAVCVIAMIGDLL